MPSKQADKIFELGRELGDLERQKKVIEDRMRQIKGEWAMLAGRRSAKDTSDDAPSNGGSNTTARILQLLAENRETVYHWSLIADSIGAQGPTVRSALAKLYADELVEKRGRGLYQAKGGGVTEA